jgi:cyclic pyranopterin phosphate synthase
VGRSQSDGPAERYRFAGAPGEIGIIRPLSRHFCGDCNRLRLTAEGKLRACLLSDRYTDIRGPLRSGAGDAELAEVFRTAVRFKPHAHELAEGHRLHVNDPMASIGG